MRPQHPAQLPALEYGSRVDGMPQLLVARLLMLWYWCKLRKVAAELDERERELQEHDTSHNEHGTHQLVTAGMVIDFHVSGKAAEKQWVKLQKMLTDWKHTHEQ